MQITLDLTRDYGIVLEGGGARGAYQIGAWKALREAGVKIKGIAGASVGSLNGALMCMDDYDLAEKIWKNIEYSHVMDVNDDMVRALKSGDYKSIDFWKLMNKGLQVMIDGGFNVMPLRKLIEEVVGDETRIRLSERELYAVTYSVSDHKGLVVDLKAGEAGSVKDMLLASAYFLAFKNEKLGGKRYMDGGGIDNVPIQVLLDRGYEDIIIIRIYGLGYDSEKDAKIPDHVRIHHIAPRQDLGGILDFDKKKARKNMTLGYFDAMRFLYGLEGRTYYIDAPYTEPYYFDKMMSETELLKGYLAEVLDSEVQEALNGYRTYTETLFPRLAVTLKLKADWNYKDLYLAILEDLAKKFKISRFHVYTVEVLIGKIMKKISALDSPFSL